MVSAPVREVARRVFITARMLKAGGHLTSIHLQTVMRLLQSANPRLTVADPLAETTGAHKGTPDDDSGRVSLSQTQRQMATERVVKGGAL